MKGDSFFLLNKILVKSWHEKFKFFFFILLAQLKIINNQKFKLIILDNFWFKLEDDKRNEVLNILYEKMSLRIRKHLIDKLNSHIEKKDKVVIISASPEFYLIPFLATLLPNVEVIASKIQNVGFKIKLINYYGEKKKEKVEQLVKHFLPEEIIFYTDSINDLPLIMISSLTYLVQPSTILLKRVQLLAKKPIIPIFD